MSASTTFNIYVMSYKRSDAIMTKNCFEYCTYVVRESEADLYRNAGIDDLLVIPEGAVDNFMSTLYWIIDNTPEEAIFVADDDIKWFIHRTDFNVELRNGDFPDKETTTAEVERIAQIMVDLGIGLGFDQPQRALYNYNREFSFKGMPGHIRWINKSAFKATYNPQDPASSDVDMMLQELLTNRIVLLPKYFLSNGIIDKNTGERDSRKDFYDLALDLKRKWGKYYSFNFKKNTAIINVQR